MYYRDVLKKCTDYWARVEEYIIQEGIQMIQTGFDDETQNCRNCKVTIFCFFAIIANYGFA
jgi:hypothetical protein